MTDSDIQKNKKTNSIAELVDLYPSICDLANISKPAHLEGNSLTNALQNPSKVFMFFMIYISIIDDI